MDPTFCIISDLTITPLSLYLTHPLDCDTTPETYSVKKEMGEMSGIWSTTHQPIYIATEMPTVPLYLVPSGLSILLPLRWIWKMEKCLKLPLFSLT